MLGCPSRSTPPCSTKPSIACILTSSAIICETNFAARLSLLSSQLSESPTVVRYPYADRLRLWPDIEGAQTRCIEYQLILNQNCLVEAPNESRGAEEEPTPSPKAKSSPTPTATSSEESAASPTATATPTSLEEEPTPTPTATPTSLEEEPTPTPTVVNNEGD